MYWNLCYQLGWLPRTLQAGKRCSFIGLSSSYSILSKVPLVFDDLLRSIRRLYLARKLIFRMHVRDNDFPQRALYLDRDIW